MAIKHKDLKKVVKELEGAVKAHGRQAKTIKQHIKDMEGPFKMKTPLYRKVPNCIPKGKLKKEKGDPCWKNYVQRGTKEMK